MRKNQIYKLAFKRKVKTAFYFCIVIRGDIQNYLEQSFIDILSDSSTIYYEENDQQGEAMVEGQPLTEEAVERSPGDDGRQPSTSKAIEPTTRDDGRQPLTSNAIEPTANDGLKPATQRTIDGSSMSVVGLPLTNEPATRRMMDWSPRDEPPSTSNHEPANWGNLGCGQLIFNIC